MQQISAGQSPCSRRSAPWQRLGCCHACGSSMRTVEMATESGGREVFKPSLASNSIRLDACSPRPCGPPGSLSSHCATNGCKASQPCCTWYLLPHPTASGTGGPDKHGRAEPGPVAHLLGSGPAGGGWRGAAWAGGAREGVTWSRCLLEKRGVAPGPALVSVGP